MDEQITITKKQIKEMKDIPPFCYIYRDMIDADKLGMSFEDYITVKINTLKEELNKRLEGIK